MPRISRHKYKNIVDIIETHFIQTECETASPETVERLAEKYEVEYFEIYWVIELDYPLYYPEEFKKELRNDPDLLKELPQIPDDMET